MQFSFRHSILLLYLYRFCLDIVNHYYKKIDIRVGVVAILRLGLCFFIGKLGCIDLVPRFLETVFCLVLTLFCHEKQLGTHNLLIFMRIVVLVVEMDLLPCLLI